METIDLGLGQSAVEHGVEAGDVDCPRWPVSKAEFAALSDLGMSDTMIAKYFNVTPSAIRTHRLGLLSAERFD